MRFPSEKDIVEGIIRREEKRQEESLNLIASENHIPAYIRAASGSVLIQKYAEGYPGRRYYPGTLHYDHIEKKATERALKLFNLSKKQWHVNAQPYSGAVANMELYLAFLKQGDTILSMALKSGGHLSHGSSVSHTGKLFHIEHYGVTEKYDIDYAELKKKAVRYKPKLIVSGASAFPKKIDFKKIGAIAKSIGALHLADISHYAGLISAGVYLSPFGYADMVMTTTHKSLFGPRGALLYVKKEFAQTLDTSVFPGMQGGPHMHTIAGIAMGLEFARENKEYYRQVIKNAKALAFALKKKGHLRKPQRGARRRIGTKTIGDTARHICDKLPRDERKRDETYSRMYRPGAWERQFLREYPKARKGIDSRVSRTGKLISNFEFLISNQFRNS